MLVQILAEQLPTKSLSLALTVQEDYRLSMATRANVVHFSVKGRVVIPRHLRKEFEIEEGTKATVVATPEGILLKPITAKFIRSLRGSLKGPKTMETFMAERKRERGL